MANNAKIYKKICMAADKYTTPANRPIMEAVKKMGKVCFMETTIVNHNAKCNICNGTGHTKLTYKNPKTGKTEEFKVNGNPYMVSCDACGGTGYSFKPGIAKSDINMRNDRLNNSIRESFDFGKDGNEADFEENTDRDVNDVFEHGLEETDFDDFVPEENYQEI